MKMLLFRHGLAMDRELAALRKVEDSQRPLLAKGRERTEKMARFLKASEESFDLIVTSPFDRATQTAHILSRHLKFKKLMECSELVPSASPRAFAQWLKIHGQRSGHILVVGHEPQLSVFASWCLSGGTKSFIDLKKSGMLSLEFESSDQIRPRSATLLWALPPRLVIAK
jgi:phosphohistidine phosphatase